MSDMELRYLQDRVAELEDQLGIAQHDLDNARRQVRELESERDDLDYRLRDVERERDSIRSERDRQVSDLQYQLANARREAERRGGWH